MAKEYKGNSKVGRPVKDAVADGGIEEIAIRAACAVFLITDNKADSYASYAMVMKRGDSEYKKAGNSPYNFFKRERVQGTLESMRNVFKKRVMYNHLAEMGISPSRINKLIKESKKDDETDISFEYVTTELKRVADTAQSDQAKIQALDKIASVAALKKDTKKGDNKENVIFYEPAEICENCPNREQIYKKYEDEEALMDLARLEKNNEAEERGEEITYESFIDAKDVGDYYDEDFFEEEVIEEKVLEDEDF